MFEGAQAAWRRHDLVWLDPSAAWDENTLGPQGPRADGARQRLARWVGDGYPLILTRQCSQHDGRLALGLPLPPQEGKQRLAFRVARTQVLRINPPLLLAEAHPALPGPWRARLEGWAQPALACLAPRLFGSLAMQALTGQPYVTSNSDLDLLLSPPTLEDLQRGLAALAAMEAQGTQGAEAPRLDGEIRSPQGGDVAWRELAMAPRRILVKSLDGVALVPLHDYLSQFAEAAMAQAA